VAQPASQGSQPSLPAVGNTPKWTYVNKGYDNRVQRRTIRQHLKTETENLRLLQFEGFQESQHVMSAVNRTWDQSLGSGYLIFFLVLRGRKDAMAKTSLLVALTALFVGVLLSFSTGEVWAPHFARNRLLIPSFPHIISATSTRFWAGCVSFGPVSNCRRWFCTEPGIRC